MQSWNRTPKGISVKEFKLGAQSHVENQDIAVPWEATV
jgi:hypothetical protein